MLLHELPEKMACDIESNPVVSFLTLKFEVQLRMETFGRDLHNMSNILFGWELRSHNET